MIDRTLCMQFVVGDTALMTLSIMVDELLKPVWLRKVPS